MTENSLKMKDIMNMLQNGEKEHANLFVEMNKGDYIITSQKGSEGYYWDAQSKLWKQLFNSILLNHISDFLNKKIKQVIEHLNKKKESDEDMDDNDLENLKKKIDVFQKMITKTNSARHIESIIKFVTKGLYNEKFMSILDTSSSTLPIKNGKVIDLKTLNVVDRERKHYFSYEIDAELTDDTKHAYKFFSQLMCENDEKLKYFQKSLGYSITGEIAAKCFFVLIGPGGDNGKSTLMNIMGGIFDEFFQAIQKNVLFSIGDPDKQKNIEHYLAELFGQRLGVYNEPGDGFEISEAVIKAMTGNDPIVAKKLYRDPFKFIPIIKIWIMTNKYIQFDCTSEPMKKRARIFNMDASFTDNPKEGVVGQYKKDESFINDLKTIYKNEIFTWVVQGAKLYYQDKHLNAPECCKNEMEQYIEKINSVDAFLKSDCEVCKESRIERTELFELFIKWCKDNDEKMIKRDKFYDSLRSKKYVEKKSNGKRYFYGLKVKDDEVPIKKPKKLLKKRTSKNLFGYEIEEEDPYDNGVEFTEKSIKKTEKKLKKRSDSDEDINSIFGDDESELDDDDHGEDYNLYFD